MMTKWKVEIMLVSEEDETYGGISVVAHKELVMYDDVAANALYERLAKNLK